MTGAIETLESAGSEGRSADVERATRLELFFDYPPTKQIL